ncbi:hypothetical protein HDU86_002190 [Geranomyces michiganensis]|nr:hypothetical protein HDU86_002190 [Geranomyces michiganensis]
MNWGAGDEHQAVDYIARVAEQMLKTSTKLAPAKKGRMRESLRSLGDYNWEGPEWKGFWEKKRLDFIKAANTLKRLSEYDETITAGVQHRAKMVRKADAKAIEGLATHAKEALNGNKDQAMSSILRKSIWNRYKPDEASVPKAFRDISRNWTPGNRVKGTRLIDLRMCSKE